LRSLAKVIGEPAPEWRITLVDTGISNNIGERLMAVKRFVENEDIFLAIYSDGLTVVNFVGLLHTKSLRRGINRNGILEHLKVFGPLRNLAHRKAY
jgi:hypothetical protein